MFYVLGIMFTLIALFFLITIGSMTESIIIASMFLIPLFFGLFLMFNREVTYA
jgi:hypothetical protein